MLDYEFWIVDDEFWNPDLGQGFVIVAAFRRDVGVQRKGIPTPACRQAGIVGRICPQQAEESNGAPSLLGENPPVSPFVKGGKRGISNKPKING